jgi:hypothetical protein
MKEAIEQILRKETRELKDLYLQKTKTFATKEFEYAEKVMYRTVVEWCEIFGLEARLIYADHYEFPVGFYNTKESKMRTKIMSKNKIIFWDGLEKHIEMALKKAEKHYENSLKKLVERLIEKGLTDTNFEIVEKTLGVNFEMLIKYDGDKTIRCWTIIAEGEIQRPHYRYLIK